MKIALIGVTGRIGSRLATELLSHGHAVISIALRVPWRDDADPVDLCLRHHRIEHSMVNRVKARDHVAIVEHPQANGQADAVANDVLMRRSVRRSSTCSSGWAAVGRIRCGATRYWPRASAVLADGAGVKTRSRPPRRTNRRAARSIGANSSYPARDRAGSMSCCQHPPSVG